MPFAIRPVKVTRHFTRASSGSVLYQSGGTIVLCTASVLESVPPWLEGAEKGWVTAEYSMLPHSTGQRKRRDREGKMDGRTSEIQRLIGRSLRSIIDLRKLGPRTVNVDCDVLQADGGTRTASITGGFLALLDALHPYFPSWKSHPILDSVAAISVGMSAGNLLMDLDYAADSSADVDMNVVMTGSGAFVEIQGTGEQSTFSGDELQRMLELAGTGIAQLFDLQREVMGDDWPLL